MAAGFSQLLVGSETADDAAVWQLPNGDCVIATTDFFMPVVDDARDFGRIAATNAISDIYAMGGTPLFALAILGMPLGTLPLEVTRAILAGGAEACAGAGIPVAGGHSIDTAEPIYGLAVIGICKPEHLRRNSGARPGDSLILTKPIGVGVYANALRKGALDGDGYAELLASTTMLNRVGVMLGERSAVHAMTDVTGFGLLGHGLEMARASGVALRLNAAAVPLLNRARELCEGGFVTGASERNWESYGACVSWSEGLGLTMRQLLTDAQTSGGLLVACEAAAASELAERIWAAGCSRAAIIGAAEPGPAGIVVVDRSGPTGADARI